MSDRVTFTSLAVEGFRGFRDRQIFDLDASVVVISGANGTGKTSFFDALQWLLLGEVERLRRYRTRTNEEHLVNQYRLGEPAVVEAHVILGGVRTTIRRSGSAKSSLLEYSPEGGTTLRDEAAAHALQAAIVPNDGITLAAALLNAGLLQQDTMRAVLEAKSSERHEHLRRMLGLEAIEGFEDAAIERRKTAQRLLAEAEAAHDTAVDELRSTEDRIETARQRASARVPVQDIRERLSSALAETRMVNLLLSDLGLETVSLLVEELRTLAANLDERLSARARALEANAAIAAATGLSTDDLGEVRRQLAEQHDRAPALAEQAAALQEQLRLANETSARIAQLAALAIPLLADTCPVCQRTIDPEHVAAELRTRTGVSANLLALQSDLAHAQEESRAMDNEIQALESRESQLVRQIETAEAARRAVAQANAGLRELSRSYQTIACSLPDEFASEDGQELISRLLAAADTAREFAVVLRADDEATQTARLEGRLGSLRSVVGERQARLDTTRARAADAVRLETATKNAAVRVSQERFARILPFLRDTYMRLDPHPSFTALDFRHVLFRSRGESTPIVRDELTGLEANPMLVFSAAQANIVALSYVLALNSAQQHDGLPFLLLDDPLQSMDDINVLAFADLCRHVRARQQLIIATHSPRFASLLERKLAPREPAHRSIAIEFDAWSRSGPTVSQRVIAAQLSDSNFRLLA